jgi:signal transduction histidine kinase
MFGLIDNSRQTLRFSAVAALLLLACLGPGSTHAAARPQTVLVLGQGETHQPFYDRLNESFRATVEAQGSPVTIYAESLDLNRFGGKEYEDSWRAHLATKYRGRPIGVIVYIGSAALGFALQLRDSLWPDVPIAFSLVDEQTLARVKPPPEVPGIVMELHFSDMLNAARAVVPDLNRVVILGDPLARQTMFNHFSEEIPRAAQELEITDLTGVPLSELRDKVADLPDRSAILYTAIYSNGDGTYYAPSDALAFIAAKADRPIIGSSETYLGRGSIGGYMLVPEAIGREAGTLALRMLGGEPAAGIRIAGEGSVRPVFDWRELQRWNVGESRLPPGSEVRFREVPVWTRYQWQIAAVVTALVLQTILIANLLSAHRRRRAAEIDARGRLVELAHLNRFAVTGDMSASIAHELNQPLGSILTNAQTAELLLTSDEPNVDEIKAIVADIKRDDQRASEVIRRLRSFLTKTSFEPQDVDLNETIREVLRFLSDQAGARHISLNCDLTPQRALVRGDRIQLQQVVLNLILNGMDAITDAVGGPRKISISTTMHDRSVIVSVIDSGRGISEDVKRRIFEPFFTTKRNGMGMGLSITRTILQAHGGYIWADAPVEGGAAFRFELPLRIA